MPDLTFDRRRFLVTGVGAGAAAVLLRTAAADPAAAAVPTMTTYQDFDQATHEALAAALTNGGYRPQTVSIYGPPSSPQFAAVWVLRAGPTFAMQSNITTSQLQDVHNAGKVYGFRIALLSATGSTPADARFVVVAETTGSRSDLYHSLTPWDGRTTDPEGRPPIGTFERAHNEIRFFGLIPRTLTTYGTAANPLWTIVAEPNDARVRWNIDGRAESVGEYQSRTTAQREQRARPAAVAVSPAQRLFSYFRADELTGGWVARPDLTSADYQRELDIQKGQGRWPLHLDAGGSGASRRFAAVFAPADTVAGLSMTKRGLDNAPLVDAVVERLMRDNRVRQATLAVTRGRRLLYARAFTYAESGYPIATPATYFRMASSGKTLTAMLILRMIQDRVPVPGFGLLTLATKLQEVLNLKTPVNNQPPVDAGFQSITIEHLLRHRSGLKPANPWAVRTAYNVDFPVSRAQSLSWLASQPLDFAPGSNTIYSNTGYHALGAVVEKLLVDTPYITALRSRVFGRVNASRVRLATSLPEAQLPDEARYDDPRLVTAPTIVSPGARIVPRVYGAEWDHAETDGLSVAAPDFARVLASFSPGNASPILDTARVNLMLDTGIGFDIDKIGTTPTRWGSKGGTITGQGSNVHVRENGDSFVMCINQNEVPGFFWPDWDDLHTAVEQTSWGTTDLFPDFGMLPF
jgi:CubicO group peptidase (beta-lactamase class C family)